MNDFAVLRPMLSDERWSTLGSILLEEGIYDNKNLRATVEGVLYRMRTGSLRLGHKNPHYNDKSL